MNNSLSDLDSCGIEVSARTLLVERGSEGQAVARCEFPNTPEGHQAVLRFLERRGRPVRVCMESAGGADRWSFRFAISRGETFLPHCAVPHSNYARLLGEAAIPLTIR